MMTISITLTAPGAGLLTPPPALGASLLTPPWCQTEGLLPSPPTRFPT
jgi:hypothetical protein